MLSIFPSLLAPLSGVLSICMKHAFSIFAFRCLLHLVYHGKCTLVKSEMGELLILASSLGLDLSPQSLNLDPVLPQAAQEESGVKDKQENPCNSQGFLSVEEIKEESDSPKAADLRNCMLAKKDEDPPVEKAKIEAHIGVLDMPNPNRYDILSISIFCKISLST